MTYQEHDLIATIDRLDQDGGMARPSAPVDLRSVDQFHSGGSEAVDRLISTLSPRPTDVVLDVGSGLGGPARQVAATTGCQVVGVDITAAYVEAARELTARCGLGDRVQFVHTSLERFVPARPLDAAFTMHVQMNVADKTAWFGEMASRLVPGAHLAVWEVCQTSSRVPSWPMPWSIDGSDSHLAAPEDLLAAIERAGFDPVEWVDETAWVSAWFESTFADGPPPGPSLPALLEDGFNRTLQFAGAVSDGILGVWRGAFVRRGD